MFLKKLKIDLSYDLAISYLGIYPKEVSILQRYMSAHVYCSTIHHNLVVSSVLLSFSR